MESYLSLRRLEVFCLVVETGAVTRAAEQLMIAQPAVSAQVKALEEWFGASLFTRTGGRLRPTEAGDRAYAWARETLARGVSVRRDVQELAAGEAGRVVISASMAVGTYLLARVVSSLRAERRRGDFTLHVAEPETAIHAVEAGEADIAVVTFDDQVLSNTLTYERLVDAPLVLCASPGGSPTATIISQGEMEKLPFVSAPSSVAFDRAVEAQIRTRHLPAMNVVVRLGHAEAMKQAITDHGWVAFLPWYAVAMDVEAERLRIVSVTGLSLYEPVALIQRKDRRLSPLQSLARQAIIDTVASSANLAP